MREDRHEKLKISNDSRKWPKKNLIHSLLDRPQQIQERGYAESYANDGREIITAVLVAEAEKREVR